MSFDALQKEALARVHNTTAHLWAIELRHSAFPAPVRLVQYTDDLTLTLEANAPVDAGTDQLFLGHAFRFTEPEIGTEPDPTVKIELDGVTGSLQPFLRGASQSGEPIECTLRGIAIDVSDNSISSMLDVIHLQMRGNSANITTISGRFGYTNPANQAYPGEKYTPESNPGLS